MRFTLGVLLWATGRYLKRYRPSPRHRYRPGDLEDPDWDRAIKAMAARRLASVVPSE